MDTAVDDKLVQNLKAARALLENPEAWIRNDYAQDAHGNPVVPNEPDAVCFCMLGALARVTNKPDSLHSPAAFFLGHYVPEQGFVAGFNDHPNTTHEDVLAVFDRAIAAASDPSKRL